ncbi:NusG domain II-containing protein [Denitratisoma sp. DHT3]|uniref:NusG domain II-containing protein n=1 Tax=Denitratisoma sp. DHT3 TaxID=1981880 RepID=UPI0021BDE501|nr:NusG domain II-containing protein [Denitratisoma sp. DHT3]
MSHKKPSPTSLPTSPADWLSLLRPGDWLTASCALLLVVASFPLLWRGGTADAVVVRKDGQAVAQLPLTTAKKIVVAGPLGETVVEVQPGRVRVLSDPGPRQYCVKQGWLSRPGAVAICAPNHVSLTLTGRDAGHDSLAY